MTDTPRSEHSQTRFSTPVSDLDDHRFQPSSLPRADMTELPLRPTGVRRGTIRSIANERPDLLQVSDAFHQPGMIARDFEQAIADDDKSVQVVFPAERVSRRGSIDPTTARVPGLGVSVQEKPRRSRASSTSSRSVSPPNSVDAFAAPRRRERTGTLTSTCPSDTDLGLRKTISAGGRSRRPTFNDGKEINVINDAQSYRSIRSRRTLSEEDVCFPPPEDNGKEHTIDFEELEEFVAEQETCPRTPIVQAPPPKRCDSTHSQSKPKIFSDLRKKPSMPAILPTAPGFPNEAACISSVVIDEKGADPQDDNDPLAHTMPCDDRVSQADPVTRWTFFSSEMDNSVHAADLGGLLMPGETFRDLFQLGPDGGVWWLDMFKPTEEEVTAICKAFRVHPLTKEDICTQEAREKVELFKSYYFVCFRSFSQMDKTSDDFMEPVNVYAVVFREGLLTFTFCQNPHAANVRKRIGRLRDYVSLGADWICYALIDDIVDSFGPVIRDVEHETDAIEDNVFTTRPEDSRVILRAIGDCRKKVMSLIRLLGGKADVIKGFAKRCNEQYSVAPRGDVGLYLSDIQDHVVTMMSNLGHFEKMLSRSHSNYLAQISVDNISQGNRINETLGKVTLIATILLPLNLICGLFGMNVPVPGGESGGLYWFFGILGVILCFIAACLTAAKKMKYI